MCSRNNAIYHLSPLPLSLPWGSGVTKGVDYGKGTHIEIYRSREAEWGTN